MSGKPPSEGGSPGEGAATASPAAAASIAESGDGDGGASPAVIIPVPEGDAACGAPLRKRPARARGPSRRPAAGKAATPGAHRVAQPIMPVTADEARKRPAPDSEAAAGEAVAAGEAASGAPARKRPARAKGSCRRPAAGKAATPGAHHVAPSSPVGECRCRGNCGVPRCRQQESCRRPVDGNANYCKFCVCEVRSCSRPRNKATSRWCQLIGLGF